MKHVMITQIKNQEERIFDWLFYHHKEGIDSFVIFDDFSEDGTLSEIEEFRKNFDVNLQIHKTDEKGVSYSIEQSKNSETYGSDKKLNDRILRSYTEGNNIVKKINPEAFCYFFDVDEFLVSNYDTKITDIVESQFAQNYNQLLVFNFDVSHNYVLEKGLIHKNENYLRWDFQDTESHKIWRTRCKSITIAKDCERVGFVHYIISDRTKTLEIRDYEKLRMLHFRIPNLPNSENIRFVPDNTLKNKMISYTN